jgi:hypothetical protein
MISALKPEWQSGELDAYISLLLQPGASLYFLFLLAYSIICYILLLLNPDRFGSIFAIRFGIYSGVILALQYSVILFLYLNDNQYSFTIFLLWLFPLYYPKIDQWAVRKWGRSRARLGFLALVTIAFVVVAVINREQFFPVILVLVGLVMAAPFWSLLMAGQSALWLLRNRETRFSLQHGFGGAAWLAAYAIAWRYDILRMYELYAQLPTAPPNCYIATAAACGHPQFVGSRTVQRADGAAVQVNRQLQVLKCAELALMVVNPRVHQLLRRIYDVAGKRLAYVIQTPLRADAAYLLLKPWEWLAIAVLKVIIPEVESISKKIYVH